MPRAEDRPRRALSAAKARRGVVHGMERRPVAAAIAYRLVVDMEGARTDLLGKAHATDTAPVVPGPLSVRVPSAWGCWSREEWPDRYGQ